ncbi:hypothetical protein [Streptomyces sp. NPDC058751]|uniref:hypothetical protein n=1 Tax=Streptomyces sp. NPDC058751 TaxID=3346623 RepID=UPI0036929B93
MPEYTISTADGDAWPALGAGLAAVLQPRSRQCEILQDDALLRLRTEGTDVEASWELAGTWYVYVEGAPSLEAADQMVNEMAAQLGEATGKQAVHHRITD